MSTTARAAHPSTGQSIGDVLSSANLYQALKVACTEITTHEREAARLIVELHDKFGETERSIAGAINRSSGWVNAMRQWATRDFDRTPFGDANRAARERHDEAVRRSVTEQPDADNVVRADFRKGDEGSANDDDTEAPLFAGQFNTSGMHGGTGRNKPGDCEVERGPTPGSHAWHLEQLTFHVRQCAGEMDLKTLDKVEDIVRQIVAERRAKLEAKHAKKLAKKQCMEAVA